MFSTGPDTPQEHNMCVPITIIIGSSGDGGISKHHCYYHY